MAFSTEYLIAVAIATGIRRKLHIDESHAIVNTEKPRDPNWWSGDCAYCIVPGATAPNGGSEGAQQGGALEVGQEFSIHYYGSTKLDAHTFSTSALLDEALGAFNRMEQLRQLFAMTDLGGLVQQCLFYRRETKAQWEDPQTGVYSRELVLLGMYARELPFYMTITAADLADVLALQQA